MIINECQQDVFFSENEGPPNLVDVFYSSRLSYNCIVICPFLVNPSNHHLKFPFFYGVNG